MRAIIKKELKKIKLSGLNKVPAKDTAGLTEKADAKSWVSQIKPNPYNILERGNDILLSTRRPKSQAISTPTETTTTKRSLSATTGMLDNENLMKGRRNIPSIMIRNSALWC